MFTFSKLNVSAIFYAYQYHIYVLFIFAAEIIMFEGLTCVYKSNVDLFFYVVGSSHENEVNEKSVNVVV